MLVDPYLCLFTFCHGSVSALVHVQRLCNLAPFQHFAFLNLVSIASLLFFLVSSWYFLQVGCVAGRVPNQGPDSESIDRISSCHSQETGRKHQTRELRQNRNSQMLGTPKTFSQLPSRISPTAQDIYIGSGETRMVGVGPIRQQPRIWLGGSEQPNWPGLFGLGAALARLGPRSGD